LFHQHTNLNGSGGGRYHKKGNEKKAQKAKGDATKGPVSVF